MPEETPAAPKALTPEEKAQHAADAKAATAREALLTKVLHELSHSQQRTQELFHLWDEDGSGSVGRQEFFRGLKALGVTEGLAHLKKCKKSDIDALFALIDVDDNGKLIPNELGMAISGILKDGGGGSGGEGKLLAEAAVQKRKAKAAKAAAGKEAPEGGAPAAAVAAGSQAISRAGTKAEKAAEKIEARVRGVKGRKRARVIKVAVDPSTDPEISAALLRLKQEIVSQLQKVLSIFQSWDYDSSGQVSKKEFRQGLALLNLKAPRAVIEGLFELLDSNNSGTIEYEELRSQLQAPSLRTPTKAELRAEAERKRKALARSKSAEAKRLRARAAKLEGEARRKAEEEAARIEAEAEEAAREAERAAEALRAEAEATELLRQQLLMEVVEEMVREEAEAALALWTKENSPLGRSWKACWKAMVLKDLPGYPLWTQELHDVIEPAFEELQSSFIHYCSSSIQGTESIGNATKMGLQEALAFTADCRVARAGFETADITRAFYVANSLDAIRASSSADRHRMPSSSGSPARPSSARGGSSPARRPAPRSASPRSASPRSASRGRRQGSAATGVDQQLNLYEFVNFLVRLGFDRYNAKLEQAAHAAGAELTPVPQAVGLFLDECVLPLAKRDESAAFRQRLLADAPTQEVLREYRGKLLRWMTRICRKHYGTDKDPVVLPYDEWVNLMDGPDGNSVPWSASDEAKRRARCPKMVGEWAVQQESQISGDERTSTHNRLTFRAKLSIPQVRWNFLRSQPVAQVTGGDTGASAMSTLEFPELLECVARCAVDMYAHPLSLCLPSHGGRPMMTMATATRAWLQNLLWEKSPERCMWEATLITVERFDWPAHCPPLAEPLPPGLSASQYKLWRACWPNIPLMDVHHFPLWEKGVHDTLLLHFPALTRIFSHYTKGISGIGSAAGASEMELEEFHDFVKEAKLETRLVSFTRLTNVFKQADATRTAEAYLIRVRERRHPQVTLELEMERAREAAAHLLAVKAQRRLENERPSGLMAGAYGQLAAAEVQPLGLGFDSKGRRSFSGMGSSPIKGGSMGGSMGGGMGGSSPGSPAGSPLKGIGAGPTIIGDLIRPPSPSASPLLAKGGGAQQRGGEPSARLNLTEFLGCLVRLAFLRECRTCLPARPPKAQPPGAPPPPAPP